MSETPNPPPAGSSRTHSGSIPGRHGREFAVLLAILAEGGPGSPGPPPAVAVVNDIAAPDLPAREGERAKEPEMVKKSSFLERLFGGRKESPERPGQRPRATVEGRRLDDAAGARPAAKRVDPQPQAPIEVEPLAGLEDRGNGDGNMLKPRTGKREEAVSALTDGFRDLSSLLHGVQDRMDEQSRRTGELNEKFVDLPVMAKAQVDFLSRISEQMLKNQERTAELVTRLSGLPELLDGIHKTLEKQVASEERTEKTLGDFRTTMDRIHTSIGTLTRESTAAMNTAVESFERNHDRSTQAFAEVQKRAHDSFEKSQEAYLAQIRDFVDRGNKVNRNMVWLMVMVLGALVVLFVAVLNA